MPIQIRIASPCSADWDAMPGDGRVRSCGDCKKNVYNISELTEAEIAALVVEREGKLCVRFYRRRDGSVLTADCARASRRAPRGAALASAALIATGCAVDGEMPEDATDDATADVTDVGDLFAARADAIEHLRQQYPSFEFAGAALGGVSSLSFSLENFGEDAAPADEPAE
jgi:hypothetical protein